MMAQLYNNIIIMSRTHDVSTYIPTCAVITAVLRAYRTMYIPYVRTKVENANVWYHSAERSYDTVPFCRMVDGGRHPSCRMVAQIDHSAYMYSSG